MDNRDILLTRALELFAARGYDGVGVQEIAAAAKVTKPTLYHYFGSKRGLLEALLEARLVPFEEELAKASHFTGDMPHSLEKVAKAFFSFAQSSPDFYRLSASLYLSPPQSEGRAVATPYHLRQHRLLSRMFEDAAERHGNMRGRHERYALTLRGMIDGYIFAILDGNARPDGKLLADLVQQFSYGIYS